MGSPPLVRVKCPKEIKDNKHFGITPARAGKIQKEALDQLLSQDHPRSCG